MYSVIVTRNEAMFKETFLKSIGFKENRDHGNWILKNVDKDHAERTARLLKLFVINCMVKK